MATGFYAPKKRGSLKEKVHRISFFQTKITFDQLSNGGKQPEQVLFKVRFNNWSTPNCIIPSSRDFSLFHSLSYLLSFFHFSLFSPTYLLTYFHFSWFLRHKQCWQARQFSILSQLTRHLSVTHNHSQTASVINAKPSKKRQISHLITTVSLPFLSTGRDQHHLKLYLEK